ncbi:MAG: hypothetical protein GXX95_07835 [Methanomassiliicoccus sp.]|jgi:hypothetical protein|nr:hypothetical protein [Methanomassiliicoccus sp.]
MAPLSPEDRQLLEEALEAMLHNETLEHSLGRVLRKRGLDFQRYISITSDLREQRRKDEDIESAARRLIAEG